jgi:hypothetical protein
MYFMTFYLALAITGSAALLGFAAEAISRLHRDESGSRRPSQPPPGGLRPSFHP